MPRRKPKTAEPQTVEQVADTKRAKVRSIIGGNVDPATLKKHYAAIGALQRKQREISGQISQAWKAAESDGIARRPAKLVFKLFDEDPATADAVMAQVQSYATQLGLFDKIADWKSAEEQEANKGSVARAESDVKKSAHPVEAKSSTDGEPKSGGRDEAIYAQGFEAGKNGETIINCPLYDNDADRDTWQRGHHAGAMQAVDATNSAHATEMAGAQA